VVGRMSMWRLMRRGSAEGRAAKAVEVRHRKPGAAQDKRKDGRYAGRVRLAIAVDRGADSLCGFVENAVTQAR
jgi:hypothetical protein